MDTFKGLAQPLLKFNYLEVIRKQITALVRG